jgi:type II secretion system protein I
MFHVSGRQRETRNLKLGTRAKRAGFVLLEVIVALTILGVAVAAFMRSFTLSLEAARKMEIQTQAVFFADQLMEYFEIMPPTEGEREGGFGDDYRNYSYRVNVRYEEPEYRDVEVPDNIAELFKRRDYTLEIFYDNGRMKQPYAALRLDSSMIGFEKFSYQSRLTYANF